MASNGSSCVVRKINNSYESEPSSGSGSSLSEINEGHISDEENLNLPYLLKPPQIHETPPSQAFPPTTINAYNSGPRSSQESQFLGFGDSPYGKVNKQLYGSQLPNLQLPEPQPAMSMVKYQSPGMTVFPRFYDTIVEENSCNAVDLPVARDDPLQHAKVSVATATTFTFNGKIKSLTECNEIEAPPTESSQNVTAHDNSLNTSEQLMEHNKTYNNERSPDLFADSDDDEDEVDDDDGDGDVNNFGVTLDAVPEVLEESRCATEQNNNNNSTPRYSLTVPTDSSFVDDQTLDTSATQSGINDPRSLFLENCRRERELYRRIRRCLQGVRPPPSVTTPDVDIINMVVNKKELVLNFFVSCQTTAAADTPIEDSGISVASSIFKPTHSLAEAQTTGWREILGVRQHGLSYNLNKAAEQNEYLSLSVMDRYIGVETASSYVRSPSSAKKRNMRMKMLTQSPGNRLSHLAKRRAVFSSANLAINSLRLNNSIGPQILLDKKKTRNKRKATPKRKTPGSKKKVRKTPSSSARKRLYNNDLIKVQGPSRESSKRALFQSPAKAQQDLAKLLPPKPLIKPEFANRVEKSKRALFSPDHQSGESCELNSLLLKRKRNDDDDGVDDLASQSSKLFRASSSSGLTPRALKIKSQSFCIGAGTSTMTHHHQKGTIYAQPTTTVSHSRSSLSGFSGSSSNLASTSTIVASSNKLQRAQSEMCAAPHAVMTDNQRKKLLWAVSQALQEKKISAKHENFRRNAADLARIVKRIFQEFYLGHTTSNSETLLRLAKKYAYSVISGKQADDIYLHARSQENDAKRQSNTRLSGYIGPEDFEQRKLQLSQTMSLSRSSLTGSVHNIFGSEFSIDSLCTSQGSEMTFANAGGDTQSSLIDRISEDLFSNSSSHKQSQQPQQQSQSKQPILLNAALQNSSSKNNLCGLALRENVDCEQRRSAQKNFTGKDQRNISPYYGCGSNSNGSGRKFHPSTTAVGVGGDSGAKAKRQISFDS